VAVSPITTCSRLPLEPSMMVTVLFSPAACLDADFMAGSGWPAAAGAVLSSAPGALRKAIWATGSPPKGFRAPYWALGRESLDLLVTAGFEYDSSLMADDYRPYRVRQNDVHSIEQGTTFGNEGPLIEVPVYWTLDDWPLFEPGDNGRDGMRPPSQVLEIWLAELRYAHANAPGGLLTVTMHPECIGRGHRMAMLEQFIGECRKLDGVTFSRLDTYLEGWVRGS